MLREIRDLGFEYAELSHGIRISLLPGIIEAVAAGEIKISTLHNFCPLPIGVNFANPNIFKFSSSDARERENAYRYTLKTLETAARLKAQAVVLHLGSIEMKDYTEKLIGLMEQGEHLSPKYEKLCAEAVDKREQKKEKYIKLAYEMLKSLVNEAEARGIRFGVENREALEEIPLESDFMFLFKEFPSPTVCYWHDTGHAQIKENLGFINHAMHLEGLIDRLLGFHIHDVEFPAMDHRPPGTGMIDFAALKPLVKPEHIKVFELNPGVPAEAVLPAVALIKELWGPE
jgi:sugar phosphate isomerase/epimerase